MEPIDNNPLSNTNATVQNADSAHVRHSDSTLVSEDPKAIALRLVSVNMVRSFHTAIENGDFSKVESFLKNGMSPNALCDTLSNSDFTPLHRAANAGFSSIASLLIQYGADINAKAEKDGVTPLLLAFLRGYDDVIKIFPTKEKDAFCTKIALDKTERRLERVRACKMMSDYGQKVFMQIMHDQNEDIELRLSFLEFSHEQTLSAVDKNRYCLQILTDKKVSFENRIRAATFIDKPTDLQNKAFRNAIIDILMDSSFPFDKRKEVMEKFFPQKNQITLLKDYLKEPLTSEEKNAAESFLSELTSKTGSVPKVKDEKKQAPSLVSVPVPSKSLKELEREKREQDTKLKKIATDSKADVKERLKALSEVSLSTLNSADKNKCYFQILDSKESLENKLKAAAGLDLKSEKDCARLFEILKVILKSDEASKFVPELLSIFDKFKVNDVFLKKRQSEISACISKLDPNVAMTFTPVATSNNKSRGLSGSASSNSSALEEKNARLMRHAQKESERDSIDSSSRREDSDSDAENNVPRETRVLIRSNALHYLTQTHRTGATPSALDFARLLVGRAMASRVTAVAEKALEKARKLKERLSMTSSDQSAPINFGVESLVDILKVDLADPQASHEKYQKLLEEFKISAFPKIGKCKLLKDTKIIVDGQDYILHSARLSGRDRIIYIVDYDTSEIKVVFVGNHDEYDRFRNNPRYQNKKEDPNNNNN